MGERWFRSRGGASWPVALGDRVRQVGGSLFLAAALTQDSGRYVCLANNSVGAERASTSLLVTTPLSAYMVPQQQTVDVGRPAQLNCSTEGHPQLAFSWLKDGRPIHTSARVRLVSPQTLKIEHVERTDKGMYQCFVSNNDETAQGTAEIKLGDAAPVVVSAFSAATLVPGAAWSAECEAAGSPLPALSWRRDGAPLSSDQRRVQVSVQAGGASVVGRLSVSAVRPDDGGVYECVASNAVGAAGHAAPLRVLGPPHVRPMADRRVLAHSSAAFHCRVTGYPVSDIRWQRDGRTLPINHRQLVFPNGTLVIQEIQKQADEGGYVCIATNPDGHTSRSKLNIQVLEAPEIEPIAVKSDLQQGMRMHLTCVVRKGDLPINIHWMKDGSAIPQDQDVSAKPYDEYSNILSFTSLAVRHTGNYTCQAANSAAITNYTVEIIVNDPPSWRVQPDDTETVAGKSVVLPCAAEGSPSPRILWKKNTGAVPPLYQELSSLMDNYKTMQNGSLVIYNIRPEDSGHYMCQASNGVGVALSKVIYLTVHVPARFSKQHQNVTAPRGSSAIINCTAEGDIPVSIRWYHGGEEISTELNPRITISEDDVGKGSSSVLTFKRVDRDDTSLFVCVAKNKYGTDHSEMWLIVQEPPEAPLNVHISNYSSRTINLTWEQPHNGNSPVISYIIQYKNSSVSWQKDVPQIVVSGDLVKASIKDLMPAHMYHIRMFAENSIGISNSSEVLTVTTQEEIPEAPPRDVKVIMKNSEMLIVTWEPPEPYLQHGDVIGYYIGYRIANSTDNFHYETHEVLPGMPLQHLLTNLKKHTEYTVLVQAYNRVGAGPRSQEVTATTDEDVPDAAPADVQCNSVSSQSILVAWTPPPQSQINGILLGYKVIYRPLSDMKDLFTPSEHITRDLKVELSKLEHFCNYSIEVRAFTSKGDGLSSQPIICATQEDVPGEPENMKVLVADLRTMLVSWLPPLYPNGKIKQYRIYMRSLDGMTLDTDQFDIPSEQTYYSISYLDTHHRYEFWVTAFTAVGEGAESRHVVQATTEHAPAQIAPFSRHIVAVLHEDLKLSCLAVGQPAPQYYWRKNGNAIQEDSHLQIIQGKLLVISPVERSDAGNYSCLVENIFGRDQIAYFITIHVPLAPTDIEVSSTTASSITLQWDLPPDAGHVVEGLYLYHKREFGEWEKTKLRPQDSSFILDNLQCGTKYYFYLQTFNKLGQSEPTSTITACTQGSAPIAPKNSDLIKVNSSFISLNLTSWDDGGCHITSIVIEYKVKDETTWTLVSNNVKTEQLQFIVLDLNPGTWYNLRVTAHNSAGSTVEYYNFVTLTHLGATVAPELIVYYGYGRKPFYSEMAIIVPAATGITITIAAAAILFAYLKKNHTIMSSNSYRDKSEDPEQLSDLGKKVLQNRGDSSDCGKISPSMQEPVYLPTPVRVSLGYRQDISPYATFQVPAPGGPDCSDCEEDLEPHDRNLKHIDKDGSSTDSTYSKINRKLQHGNETPEWIPLHNLYQAHRY